MKSSNNNTILKDLEEAEEVNTTFFIKYNVPDLREYLLHFGIPTSNNGKSYLKEKLVNLAVNASKLKLLPSFDKENRDELIAKKHQQDNINLPLISSLKTGWTKDLTCAPYILYPDIYNYLINKPGYDLTGLKAYKSLTAYNLMADGHVQDLQINPHGKYIFIKWKVKPTQRSKTWNGKSMYEPWAIVRENGVVLTAHHECLGGYDGACRHVAAGLFELERSLRELDEKPSCTEEACMWKKRKASGKDPVPIKQLKQATAHSNNDPRPLEVKKPSLKARRETNIIDAIRRTTPDAACLMYLSPITNSILQQTSPEDDCNIHKTVTVTTSPPGVPTMTELVKNLGNFGLLQAEQSIRNYRLSEDEVGFLAAETAGQSKNGNWLRHRQWRITGSVGHRVWTIKESTSPKNLIDCIGHKEKKLNGIAAIEYGKEKEEVAILNFEKANRKKHEEFCIERTGLHVLKDRCYIGASPDGLISCDCCITKTLEVKSIFSRRNDDPKQVSRELIHCFLSSDETVRLKPSSPWYTQIQMQMLCTSCTKAILLICTDKGFHEIFVEFNVEFCNDLVSKIESFWFASILPELLNNLR